MQGNKASPSKVADVVDCVPTSPSRFQVLANISEEDEQEDGEIPQEDEAESDDVFNLRHVIQGVVGKELKQRNLRPQSTTRVAGTVKYDRKGNDKKDDKKVNGNGKHSKASGRKH